MDKTEAKFIRLTTQPVFPLLCALSAPAIGGMLIPAYRLYINGEKKAEKVQ